MNKLLIGILKLLVFLVIVVIYSLMIVRINRIRIAVTAALMNILRRQYFEPDLSMRTKVLAVTVRTNQ